MQANTLPQPLDRIDRVRRTASGVVVATALFQSVLFFKLLTMVDFSVHLQVMLLLSSALILGTLGLGMIALGGYMRFWLLQRVETPRLDELNSASLAQSS